MTKYVMPEILNNNNGLQLLFKDNTLKERLTALSKMKFDLENGLYDSYTQYSDEEREQLLTKVKNNLSLLKD